MCDRLGPSKNLGTATFPGRWAVLQEKTPAGDVVGLPQEPQASMLTETWVAAKS